MMASGHQVVGFTFGVAAVTWLPSIEISAGAPLETVLFFVFVLFGSLLPDIDTPNSKLGHKFWRGLITILTSAFLVYLLAPEYLNTYRNELKVFVMLLLPILIMIKSHRKMTHSIFFVVLMVIYSIILEKVFQISWIYINGVIIGILSHLFGDFLTKKGIPLFYPLSNKHIQFPVTFRTGSISEKVVVYSIALCNLWFLIHFVF